MPRYSDTRLTNNRIRSAKPGDTLSDAACPGLSLRVTSAGRHVFSYRYRVGSKQRRVTLGEWSDAFTLEQARAKARATKEATDDGRDPTLERKRRKSGITFKEAAALYVEDRALHCKPGSIVQIEQLLRLHLLPVFGDKLLREISRGDAHAWMVSKAAATTKIIANRALVVAKAIFFKMKDLERFQGENPFSRIRKYPEEARERYLSADERARLEEVLEAKLEAKGRKAINPSYVHAIRLLALTGMRKDEVCGLRWSEVDLERGLVFLPDERSKTGARGVPLTPQARDYLLRLHDSRSDLCPLVCPSSEGTSIYRNLARRWLDIRREAGLSDVRIHDLRHSWASDAINAGIPLEVIQWVLGHSQIKTTQRYAHLQVEKIAADLERVGAAIEEKTKRSGRKVLPLKRTGDA